MTTQQPRDNAQERSGGSNRTHRSRRQDNHNKGVRTVRRVNDNASRTGIVRKADSGRVPVQPRMRNRNYGQHVAGDARPNTKPASGGQRQNNNRRRSHNNNRRRNDQRGRRINDRNESNNPNQHLIENYFSIVPMSQATYSDIKQIPKLKDGDLRVVPVCGVEGIGTNMIFVEYKDEIVIIDAGFGFSDPDTPGINYTIPNISYLEANKHKIKGLVITHGHLDHVGGIPFVIERLGCPTIYTREFGAIFIRKKLEEYQGLAQKVTIETMESFQGYVALSENLKVKFFGLTHSIPDSTGVLVNTPLGSIVSTGDVRVENENGVVKDSEIEQYKFFKDEEILLLTMDSTGIEKPGWSISEEAVAKNIDNIIKEANGRLFIASFSSQVERLMEFMKSAKKHNKYVAFEGRSMKSNMAIADHLELTDFSHVVPLDTIDEYPPNKIVVFTTGAQGEQYAALSRIANNTHKLIKLRDSDTIVLSSSIVPGNHHPVTKLKNNLYKGSYNVITYNDHQVHASGHGTREELRWIHDQINYKFFMPVHGEPYMVRMHAKMAEKELGVPRANIVTPDNGSIIEIRDGGKSIVKLDQKVPSRTMVVDGKIMGPLHDVVMRDRLHLSEDGMFVVVATLDPKTGKLRKSPDIISRGFIYLRENQDLLRRTRGLIKRTVEKHAGKRNVNFDNIKNDVSDAVSKFLVQKTGKSPIVIPVVLGV